MSHLSTYLMGALAKRGPSEAPLPAPSRAQQIFSWMEQNPGLGAKQHNMLC